jgi:hypothetical protein
VIVLRPVGEFIGARWDHFDLRVEKYQVAVSGRVGVDRVNGYRLAIVGIWDGLVNVRYWDVEKAGADCVGGVFCYHLGDPLFFDVLDSWLREIDSEAGSGS